MANADGVSLLAFVHDTANLDALRSFADLHGLGNDNVLEGGISSATEHLADHTPPNLLIVEIPKTGDHQAMLDALADVCTPDTKVVIAGHINEYSFFCWLQDIGIFHYLLLPLSAESLDTLYQKVLEKDTPAEAAGKKIGQTIGVMGTRGGSGATSLSILLGAMIAEKQKQQVGVIELDPLDGTAALLLDVEPSHGLREAIEKPDRIDEMFLERVMIRMHEHLFIMSAEEDLSADMRFNADAAEMLLPALKERFAYSFIDISHHFNPFSLKAAQLCDQLLIISPMNLQGLRDAMRINTWLKDKCDIHHQQFIGNRVGETPKHEVIQTDYEKSLGVKLAATLPFSPEVFTEITNDLAVLKKTKAEGYAELVKLAQLIEPSLIIDEEKPKKGTKSKGGLLKKK